MAGDDGPTTIGHHDLENCITKRKGHGWMDGIPALDPESNPPFTERITYNDLALDNLPPFWRALPNELVAELDRWVEVEKKLARPALGLFWPADFHRSGVVRHNRRSWTRAGGLSDPKANIVVYYTNTSSGRPMVTLPVARADDVTNPGVITAQGWRRVPDHLANTLASPQPPQQTVRTKRSGESITSLFPAKSRQDAQEELSSLRAEKMSLNVDMGRLENRVGDLKVEVANLKQQLCEARSLAVDQQHLNEEREILDRVKEKAAIALLVASGALTTLRSDLLHGLHNLTEGVHSVKDLHHLATTSLTYPARLELLRTQATHLKIDIAEAADTAVSSNPAPGPEPQTQPGLQTNLGPAP